MYNDSQFENFLKEITGQLAFEKNMPFKNRTKSFSKSPYNGAEKDPPIGLSDFTRQTIIALEDIYEGDIIAEGINAFRIVFSKGNAFRISILKL